MTISELNKGDILRTAFGDESNIVEVEVERIEPTRFKNVLKIIGHYTCNNNHVEMNGYSYDMCEVIRRQYI